MTIFFLFEKWCSTLPSLSITTDEPESGYQIPIKVKRLRNRVLSHSIVRDTPSRDQNSSNFAAEFVQSMLSPIHWHCLLWQYSLCGKVDTICVPNSHTLGHTSLCFLFRVNLFNFVLFSALFCAFLLPWRPDWVCPPSSFPYHQLGESCLYTAIVMTWTTLFATDTHTTFWSSKSLKCKTCLRFRYICDQAISGTITFF